MRRNLLFVTFLAIAALSGPVATPALADDELVVIVIKGGKFVPSEVTVPTGKKIKITVRNQDTKAAEFESSDLHREKVVQPGAEVTMFVGPLDAGSYEFFDDFHLENRGHLIAK